MHEGEEEAEAASERWPWRREPPGAATVPAAAAASAAIIAATAEAVAGASDFAAGAASFAFEELEDSEEEDFIALGG